MTETKTKRDKPGQPPKYETVEELDNAINDYFENGIAVRKVAVKRGNTTVIEELPVPTITGLVLHLGFSDRQSFYDQEKRKGFSHTIKKARTSIEKVYEEVLQSTGNTGAIFALKNFGWRDKQEIDHTSAGKPILAGLHVPTNDSTKQDTEDEEASAGDSGGNVSGQDDSDAALPDQSSSDQE